MARERPGTVGTDAAWADGPYDHAEGQVDVTPRMKQAERRRRTCRNLRKLPQSGWSTN